MPAGIALVGLLWLGAAPPRSAAGQAARAAGADAGDGGGSAPGSDAADGAEATDGAPATRDTDTAPTALPAAVPLPECPDCNLLIVNVDTLRADHLGYHGYRRATSPAIDAFVADARRHDAALAQATWTVPSTTTLLCSAYPATHGMMFHPGETDDWHALGDGLTSIAEVLHDAGFATAAWIGNPVLQPRLGLDRGFDRWVMAPDPQVIAEGARQIARWGDDRFFLYLHLLGPHPGLDPPPPFDTLFGPAAGAMPPGGLSYQHLRIQTGPGRADWERWYRDLYDAEIRYTDKLVGDLLALLAATGVLDETVVVFTSDHGEHLFDHGHLGHGMTVFEALTHVPLAIRVPGDPVRRDDRVVEQVDLAPALLDVLGVPRDPAWAWDGDTLGGDDQAFVEQGPRQALRRGAFKLIRDRSSGSEQLFDLTHDPGETIDVGAVLPDVRDDLRARLDDVVAGVTSTVAPRPIELDEDTIEQLRALGYVP